MQRYLKRSLICIAILMLVSGCDNVENEPNETKMPSETTEVTPTPISSLEPIEVEYTDGLKITIDNEEFIRRFKEAFETPDYIESTKEMPFYEPYYTLYFDGHTIDYGFAHIIIDDRLIETYDPDSISGEGYPDLDQLQDVLFEISYTNCLESNDPFHFSNEKEERVYTLDELFDETATFKNFERGTIDASFFYGAPSYDDSIVPIYDFNEDMLHYNFYDREIMAMNVIEYDWNERAATLGSCTYDEKSDSFGECSDYEKAWIDKMIDSFGVNYQRRYISYEDFMAQKDDFYAKLLEIQDQS